MVFKWSMITISALSMLQVFQALVMPVPISSRAFSYSKVPKFEQINILRRAIIFDSQMPSAYVNKSFKDVSLCKSEMKSMFSIEHIFPRSFMQKRDHNDMHNTIRTISALNVNRSNYRFTDVTHLDYDRKNWIQLDFGNYVNHKLQLFIPNEESRGFIARAILYMCKEYGYNSSNVIYKDVLFQWFCMYPPDESEKYHNELVKQLQNKNNMYVSNYRKLRKSITLKKL